MNRTHRGRRAIERLSRCLMLAAAGLAAPASAHAQQAPAQSDALEALLRKVEILAEENARQREQIEQLTRELERAAAPTAAAPADERAASGPGSDAAAEAASDPSQALDAALQDFETKPTPQRSRDLWTRPIGGANLRLIDVSLDTLFAAGFSTVDSESELEDLQGGEHDPRNQGFTLQQAELSFTGAVDPYFSGEAHVIASTDGVELEEAFITTSALPYGLQLEMGYFLTEFGRINPQHPHQWDWLDQPVVNTRMFGGEGLRSPGFRLGWLTPLPWASELHFGMQNADEEDLTNSFISGEPVGGRPSVGRDVDGFRELLYLARWTNSWDPTPETTALIGFSGLHGPNDTGNDGDTWIYGLDFTLKWRPHSSFRGWPFVTWQTEIMKRDYHADAYEAGTAEDDESGEFDQDLPSDILRDVGGYTQVVYGFRPAWAAGLRFEYAGGHEPSVIDGEIAGRSDDAKRADRFRFSPLLTWWPSHFSRLRFQYNLDWADQLDDTEHTFWLGAEILYGAHAGHNF